MAIDFGIAESRKGKTMGDDYDPEKAHKILADRFAEFKAREAGVL